MATHTDTTKLSGYQQATFPSLGNEQRYIDNELGKISIAINNLVAVMKLLEARMNANGLT